MMYTLIAWAVLVVGSRILTLAFISIDGFPGFFEPVSCCLLALFTILAFKGTNKNWPWYGRIPLTVFEAALGYVVIMGMLAMAVMH